MLNACQTSAVWNAARARQRLPTWPAPSETLGPELSNTLPR